MSSNLAFAKWKMSLFYCSNWRTSGIAISHCPQSHVRHSILHTILQLSHLSLISADFFCQTGVNFAIRSRLRDSMELLFGGHTGDVYSFRQNEFRNGSRNSKKSSGPIVLPKKNSRRWWIVRSWKVRWKSLHMSLQ